MIILHISDLHIQDVIENKEKKINSIVQILKTQYSEQESVLIFFTGDISKSGSSDEYKNAEQFVNDLINKIGIDKKIKIALCPGNHDRLFNLKETRDKAYVESINKSTFETEINKNLYLSKNYNVFEQKFFIPTKVLNDILKYKDIKVEDFNIRVYSLNDSLLSSYTPGDNKNDYNKNNIFIRDEYLDFSRENNDFVFVLTHIPLTYLKPCTLDYLKNKFSNDIDFFFTGHTHTPQIGNIINEDSEITEFTSSAIDSKGMSGFSLTVMDGEKLECSYYAFETNEYVFKFKTSKKIKHVVSTSFGQRVSEDYIHDLQYSEIFDGEKTHTIPLRDIFVFPQLSYKKYNNQIQIKTFEHFEQKRPKNGVTKIMGDVHSGKTYLTNYLFDQYRKNGFLPIICRGDELGNNFERSITKCFKDLYSSKNRFDNFSSVDKEKRILIIDNLVRGSRFLFREALKYFGSIIYTTLSSKDFVSSEEEDNKYEFEAFDIEPFYYDKRTSIYKKIYNYIYKANPSLLDSLDLNTFTKQMENKLKELDYEGMADPQNLVQFSLLFINKRSLSFESSNALFQAKLTIALDKALKEGGYEYCDSKIAEDLISFVAMKAYEKQASILNINMFEEAIEQYKLDHGGKNKRSPIKNVERFIQLLIDINILKQNNNDISFYSRKIFAHYVAKYAVVMKHTESDDRYLKSIIENGIYKPINLQILFSIASYYDYRNIPLFFANELYDSVMAEPEMKFDSFKPFFDALDNNDENFKKLELSKDLRNKVRERQGRLEEKERKKYLEHKDDYFYYGTDKQKSIKLDDLLNKTLIVSSLLNNFASVLKNDTLTKLVEMLTKLPYAIINLFLSDIIDKIDFVFVRVFDQLSRNPEIKVTYKYVKNSIIDEIRASILMIFDVGSRLLRNKMVFDEVKTMLEENKDKMHIIQRMMLLSFSADRMQFIDEATEEIESSSDKFISSSTRLIGYRFCVENYEWVEKNSGEFIQVIANKNPNSAKLIKERSKRRK